MPRYYFHLRDDLSVDDEEGVELAGPDAARDFAIESARDLICASVRKGHLNLDHRLEVTDEGGEKVLTMTFGEAVRIEGL